MKKIKNAVVKTGEYESGGQKKGRWQNVGSLMEDDKGGQFLMLNKWFNPAGVPTKDGSDSVVISFFNLKEKTDGPTKHDVAKQNAYQPQPEQTDDIPF